MERRKFLAASLATSALALGRRAEAQAAAKPGSIAGREFYQIRRYKLFNGPQTRLTAEYFEHALVPALTRLGLGPIGVFSLTLGPETPTDIVVIPGRSVEELTTVDLHLNEDADFQKAAEPWWSAPASQPSFLRVESALYIAFEGWPKITPPEASATKGKRIFQMRTYESPSYRDHVVKVDMFHHGEFDYFKAAGLHSVFYGDMLVGPRMPCLTYMLSMDSLEQLNDKWAAFGSNPGWRKLSADPKYGFEPTVSNIDNLVLAPMGMSQI